MGVVSLPSERSTRFGNPAWPGGRTANFAAFGSWSEALPKNAESLRNSDAPDARRCPAGVAAPLGCVICLQLGDVAVFSLCAQYFFPGSLSTIPCAVTFSANMQISLSVISVANSFALWYDKSHKSGLFGDEGEPE